MRKYLLALFYVLLMTLFSIVSYAEVYKWKQGTVTQYSDTPPQTGVPYEQLKRKKVSNTSAQEDTATEQAKSVGLLKNEVPATDKANTNKTPEQQEIDRKGREKSCATAKENLQKLKNGGSIFKENAKGERTYLDEASIKSEIAAAEKEMKVTCP